MPPRPGRPEESAIREDAAPSRAAAGGPVIRVGVDTGGTFTDVVIRRGRSVEVRKVLSTPRDPSSALLQGVRDLLSGPAPVFIVHGTTVATNALLERTGGPIAFVTTAGFEDILRIGRQTRSRLYALEPEERVPLVPPGLSFGLDERMLASGRPLRGVDARGLARVVRRVRASGVPAVAVCLLHAYANPAHEARAARALRAAGLLASVSSEFLPEHREYERGLATALNAYLMPVMDRYLSELDRAVAPAELRVMQSNEGYISPAAARREPLRTALSGPAGGAVGALRIARTAGFPDIVSFDMGGTSTDVSLLQGRIRRTAEGRVGDFPVRLPMIDIHSVGAGGGSIAFRDAGGSLRVGPRSAGANPGPACYGIGDEPTVTDADLLLGRLDPDFFLGGAMRIRPERSRRALEALGRRIGKSAEETALGVVAIANANMEKAIRVISVERGYDPRAFSLFSFGGAGGMHAVELADRLRMPRVVVPRHAGVLSALGLLLADSVRDATRSVLREESALSARDFERLFGEMERESVRAMAADGFRPADVALERSLDLRYAGQSYEIPVPFRAGAGRTRSFLDDFHREHRRLYSYDHAGRPVEVVNLRLRAVAASPKLELPRHEETRAVDPAALVKRQAIRTGRRIARGAVYDRSRLRAGNRMAGPALVIDPESTTYLPDGCDARVDPWLNLVLRRTRP